VTTSGRIVGQQYIAGAQTPGAAIAGFKLGDAFQEDDELASRRL
jgi:hypothetical protein